MAVVDGRVQKWGSTQLEKDLGPYPWGNDIIKAACEDADGNLIVGTLGAGVFWYDAGREITGRFRRNRDCHPRMSFPCAWISEGNLWVGTDGGGLDRIKRKIFNTPDGLHPWNVQSLSEDAHGGLWVAFGAQGAAYWRTNSVQDFHVGPFQDAWTVLVDQPAARLGRNAG